MAFNSASAVLPTPAADKTVKANASVAGTSNGSAHTFVDNLDAVLAQAGAEKTSARPGTDSNVSPFASGELAKLKSKLNNGEAGIALTPQALQQQQAILQKLDATSTGIDLPALRAAMGSGTAAPGKVHIMPVVNPVTGKVSAAAAPVNDVASKSVGANPSQPAVMAATQAKLAASLVKTAKAPILKSGEADGGKVPNPKIAHPSKTEKTTDTETVQSVAAKIAATAAVANAGDTAQTAAKGVADAEISCRTATAATQAQSVTKIEAAAVSNATQVAVHAPTSQEKIEAQALPIQFDTPFSKQDSDADKQSGTHGKDQNQSGSARTASDVFQKVDAPAANFADNAQSSTPTPSHASATATNNNTVAANANTATSAPVTPPNIATTLQVSQQPQHSTPSDDATFAALGVAIAAKSKDGEKQFDINMHPAELGRVDVRISVDTDGKAQAHLSAEHPQTLQLLQNDKATLERNLRDAGLDVANNGLSFSLKGEQQSSTPTFNARSHALSIATVQTADVSSTNSGSSLAPGDSRLDIRV